jgi:hypothetical protein
MKPSQIHDFMPRISMLRLISFQQFGDELGKGAFGKVQAFHLI